MNKVFIDLYSGAQGPTLLIKTMEREGLDIIRKEIGLVVAERQPIDVEAVPGVRITGFSGLIMALSDEGSSLRRHRGLIGDRFMWACSSARWDEINQLIEPLYEGSGHQYLTDSYQDDALIEFSHAEPEVGASLLDIV